MTEVNLGDTGSELTLDTAPPQETADELNADAVHQARARKAVEPLGPMAGKGHAQYPHQRDNTLHIQNFKVGDEWDAMAPCVRRATVTKVAGNSCIVDCLVMRNIPKRNDKGILIDNFVPLRWQEAWALRTIPFEDDTDARIQWKEQHVVVTQESRSQDARHTKQSPVLDTYVRIIPAEGNVPGLPAGHVEVKEIPAEVLTLKYQELQKHVRATTGKNPVGRTREELLELLK